MWVVGSIPPINGRLCAECGNSTFRIVSHRPLGENGSRYGGNVYTVVCTAPNCAWQFDHERGGEFCKAAASVATPIGKKAAV